MDTKKSTDFYFVAALLSLGAKLENTDKTDPRHMEFEMSLNRPEFKSEALQSGLTNSVSISYSVDLDHYEKEWANESLQVNATKYKDAIQRLKSVIHSK